MAAGAHQGIAAFGSLHTSIIFTAAVAAHMLGLGRRLRIGLWTLFGLTTIATVYCGWHYVVDDLAGIVIAVDGARPRTRPDRLRAEIAWRGIRCGPASRDGPRLRPSPRSRRRVRSRRRSPRRPAAATHPAAA